MDARSGAALPADRAHARRRYEALKTVYESKQTRDQKLAEKAKIIDELVVDLKLRKRPNNATLTEARVYNGGAAPILEAHRACGDLASLVAAGKTLRRGRLLQGRCRTT